MMRDRDSWSCARRPPRTAARYKANSKTSLTVEVLPSWGADMLRPYEGEMRLKRQAMS